MLKACAEGRYRIGSVRHSSVLKNDDRHVPDHADDLPRRFGAEAKALTDRRGRPAKELLRRAGVDDEDRNSVGHISRVEETAGNERHIERREERRRHVLSADARRLRRVCRARVDRYDRTTIEWRRRARGDGRYTGDRTHGRVQLTIVGVAFLGGVERIVRKVDRSDPEVRRVEAERLRVEPHEGLRQQRRGDEHDDGDRHLTDEKSCLRALGRHSRPAFSTCMKRIVRIGR